MRITRAQALSWRLGRQFLTEQAGAVEQVVGRLCAVPAWSGDPDLAVRRRLGDSAPGEVARGLGDGRLIKTYAFRGATHLMVPQDAGHYLALRAASRMWELPSWVDHYQVRPQDWPELREIVREVVARGPVHREQLVAGMTEHPRFRHLAAAMTDRSDTFLKPFAWQGDLCFGPDHDGRATFQAPSTSTGWAGIPDLEIAGPTAVVAYVDAYGPTTPDHLRYWLGEGLGVGRKRITRWIAELANDLVEVDVDGQTMLHARTHVDALMGQAPSTSVTLLPGYDQWVLGPGTADQTIVPPQRRAAVTRGAKLVLVGGVVSGTWKTRGSELSITWFNDVPVPSADNVDHEVERLALLLDRRFDSTIKHS